MLFTPRLFEYDLDYQPFNAKDVLENKTPNITIGTIEAQHIHEECYFDKYYTWFDEPTSKFAKTLKSKKVVVLSAPTFHFGIEEENSL